MPEINSLAKPKVLVCILCGSERHGWINPRLSTAVVNMSHDPRFAVQLEWLQDLRPVEYARNLAFDKARSRKVDWCVQIDNDTAPIDPLSVLVQAAHRSKIDIIGLSYGAEQNGKFRVLSELNGENAGPFAGVKNIAAGCLMVRSNVWNTLPAPWFRWVNGEDELLSPNGGCGEDVYFVRTALAAGFKLWTHHELAGHFHSTDITALAIRH